jgi:glycosyltransferase involved in cell wall biosynthesis
LKIWLTTHQFFPDFTAGTEVLTLSTAKALIRRGHDVTVVTAYPAKEPPDPDACFDKYVYDGVPVLRFHHVYTPALPPHNVIRAEYDNVFFGRCFSGLLEADPPDIVHVFHMMRLSTSVITACRNAGVPMVFTPTDFWVVCPTCQLRLPDGRLCTGPDRRRVNCFRHVVENSQPESMRKRVSAIPDWLWGLILTAVRRGILSRWKYAPLLRSHAERLEVLMSRVNQFERVLVPTRLMEEILTRYGLSPDRVELLPFGLDVEGVTDIPKTPPAEVLRVGFIGTLAEHKGAHILVDAVRRLPEKTPVQVDIYGKLDEFPEYTRRLTAAADADRRIRFNGTFPNREIGNIFAGLDILVIPSLWYENTPLVLYTAQAAKTPVIGTRLGGIAEVIEEEENGLLFEKGDVATLSEMLADLAEHRHKVDRMAEMAKPPLSISGYVDRLEIVYREISHETNGVPASVNG